MPITLRSFSTLVSNGISVAKSTMGAIVSFGEGSVELALLEASAGTSLWLQYLAYQVFMRTRLSTSQGTDCDSFVNDYGMTRLPGTPTTGLVVLSCFNYTQTSAAVAVGSSVRTIDGTMYSVTQDSTNPNWSAAQSAYIRPQGVQSITVPVQAQVAGASGNAAVGAICLLGSAIPGIDTVSNTAAFVNGADQETDAQLRARFPLWLSSKATASRPAVLNAIVGVQNGISAQLLDCQDASGNPENGYFTAVVDDGSGNPPDSLLSQVYANVAAVKALGVGFAVVAPIDILANVSMTVAVPTGTSLSNVMTAIQNAITSDIEAQQVGAGYLYSRLGYLAYTSAGAQVNGVSGVTLNGGTQDIPAQTRAVVRPGTISINVVYS